MSPTLLLLACLACAGAADDAGWFGDANLVTTPGVDQLDASGAANDTAVEYEDDEYFEGDAVDEATNASVATNSSVTPTTPKVTAPSSAEGRRAKAASNSGKTEEVNYWQTDGLADQPSRSAASEEASVSVKEHDRNPHPFAFSSSGDNEWFGFGGGGGGGSGSSSFNGGGSSKSRLGSSASVTVEDYQTKEQAGPKEPEVESVVEIKEHDELAPGAGGAPSSADGQWFGDFGSSNSKAPSDDGGGGGGGDVWFGAEASEWQPVAAAGHRQQRKLNWGDYEALDIITAPPARDVYSFVVESGFGRGGGSAKKDTDGVDPLEIVTVGPADLAWFGAAPGEPTKKVVKSRTSTTTVRSTVVGRSRVAISRNHSFVDLLVRKSAPSGDAGPKALRPGVAPNVSSALGVPSQNGSVASPVGAREEGNSVNASPTTAAPTTTTTSTTAAPTTTAPTTTTTAPTTAAPKATKNAPKVFPTSNAAPEDVSGVDGMNATTSSSDATTTSASEDAPASSAANRTVAPEPVSGAGGEVATTPATPNTTAATVPPTRSGRTFAEAAPRPKHSQSSHQETPANFTAASAASEPRTVVLRGDANGRLQSGGDATHDNLSYILVGACCGVSLVCLAVVVVIVRRRKALRRRRHAPPPFVHGPPTSYSYPPSARAGHGAAVPQDAKARMWFMGRKQSPYSLCDQHLSYAASDYGRRHSDGGALAKVAPPPPPAPVYRTGFSGLSDARHSSGLDYMNKGEMIYWSSNNEQLI